ncbi:MAG TPA: BON domain-containing protein [Candidatus Polarisedimenticolaceae bacterium]|nr:BON domain-containing protein [Candidatus Polarisedimenticolaceae bacterium]
MDRYRDRSVMDRNRDTERDDNRPYGRGREEQRNWGEDFDREGYTRESRLRGREPEWERDRYGRGGGYGQGSAGGYNEQHTSDYRSDHGGEDRWRQSREYGGRPGRNEWGREDRAGGWTASQYDRGGWGSGNASQTWGGGSRSSGAGYEDGYDRGRGREYGRGSTGEVRDEWNRGPQAGQHSGTSGGYGGYGGVRPSSSWQGRYAQESYREQNYGREHPSHNWDRERDRDREWNEDTRDDRGGPGIMESIGRFFGFGPKNYRRSDERITEEVNDRLYRHPDIDASDIDVTVREAEVTLSGTVDDRRAKYLAEDLVDQVMGVKEVNNQLRVRKQERAGSSHRGMGMGGSTLGTPSTSPMMGTTTTNATEGTGTTGTLGQSQTGTTRDLAETPRSRNK